MEKLRKCCLWVLLEIGIIWNIYGYVSTAKQWGDANLTYFRYLAEGGFFTLLIPIVLWFCFYSRAYYILVFSILIIAMAIGWGAW